MISIIYPSRSRPEKCLNTLANWTVGTNPNTVKFIVSVDFDDPLLESYKNRLPAFSYGMGLIINNNRSAVDAINNAAKVATENVFIVVSDDTDPCDGIPERGITWDAILSNEIKGKIDFILKTQDGIQPWLITMPVLDRAYYNRLGYIYYPGYQHMFCDTELTCVADITGRKITSNLLFPHKHYSVTKQQPDEINKKADATWAQGEKLFLERYKRNFDLPKGGKIQDNGMIQYLERKLK